jgi:hypothetical protein
MVAPTRRCPREFPKDHIDLFPVRVGSDVMSETAITWVMFAFLAVAVVLFSLDQVLGVIMGVAGFVVVVVLLLITKEMKEGDNRRVSSEPADRYNDKEESDH